MGRKEETNGNQTFDTFNYSQRDKKHIGEQ